MASRRNPVPSPTRRTPRLTRAMTLAAMLLIASATVVAQQPAQSESEPDAPQALDGAALLRQSSERIATYRTVKASMTETVEFGPRRFRAEGQYLQGANNRVRVDLQASIGENKGRLLQVSEGDVLWTVYEIGEKPQITRRDVNQILAAVNGEAAKANQIAELGLGGLPALLASIEESNTFEAPRDANVEGRPFKVLQGEWKQELRAQFQGQAQQLPSPSAQLRPLPPHVPDLVRIYLDAETLFPYRIRYLKRGATAGAEPIPVLTLDFQEIVVNAPVDPSEFRYTPPAEAQVADITSLYLQQIRSAAERGSNGQPPAGAASAAAAAAPAGRSPTPPPK